MSNITGTDCICISNEKVLRKMKLKRTLVLRKKQLKFLGHLTRKEGLQNLIHTANIKARGAK